MGDRRPPLELAVVQSLLHDGEEAYRDAATLKVILPERLYDDAQACGYDMSGFVRRQPLPEPEHKPTSGVPMTHEMLYLAANADIPRGVVTSTARRGRKWFDLCRAGDTLLLKTTESGNLLGRAVVTHCELRPLDEVLARAELNHVGQVPLPPQFKSVSERLAHDLTSAYGPMNMSELFTVVSYIVINE